MTPLDHLLYFEVFVNNPASQEMRIGFATRAILQLLGQEAIASLADGAQKITATFSGAKLDLSTIDSALAALSSDGFAEKSGVLWMITEKGRSLLEQAANRTSQSRAILLDQIIRSIEQTIEDKLHSTEVAAVRDTALDVIGRIFFEEETALSILYSDPETGRWGTVIHHRAQEHAEYASTRLRAIFGPESQLRATKVAHALCRALSCPAQEATTFLADLHYTIISGFFVRHPPEQVRGMRALASRLKLVLDTNVLLAAIFPTNPLHALVESTLAAAASLKIPIFVTQFTKEEYERIYAIGRNAARHALVDVSFEAFLVSSHKAIAGDYLAARRRDPSLTLNDFDAMYTPLESVMLWKGIKLLEDDISYTAIEQASELSTCRNAVRGAKSDAQRDQPSPESLEHDARLLVTMDRLAPGRNRERRPDRGYKLITLDTTLRSAVRELKESELMPDLEFPLSPSELGTRLVPLVATDIEEGQYTQYVSAVLASNLGLTTAYRGMNNLALMAQLGRCGLPLKVILEQTGEERDRIVRKLVESKELRTALQQERTGEPGTETNEMQERIRTIALKTIEDAIAFRDGIDLELNSTHERLLQTERELSEKQDLWRASETEMTTKFREQEGRLSALERARSQDLADAGRRMFRWKCAFVVASLSSLGLGTAWLVRLFLGY